MVAGRFRPAAQRMLAGFPAGSVVFGCFHTSIASAEELVVGLVATDEVEIHCHGGRAAVEAVCDALQSDGCTLASYSDWLFSRHSDHIQAQAVAALALARTQRAAAILLDQHRGALRQELVEIERRLQVGDLREAADRVELLLARAQLGMRLTKPWQIVIAGRPNAGKSSLMNALVGYERAIVYSEPGTTRDVLTAAGAIEGWPVEFIDTAGLRAAAEPIEAEGVARAEHQIEAADLVLLVADATVTWYEADYEHVARLSCRTPDKSRTDARLIVVHNKIDVAGEPGGDRPAGIAVSAKTGAGLLALCRAISDTLVPETPLAGAAVPFHEEQVEKVVAAARAIAGGDVAAAISAVKAI
jgi:tRNA modification GTPase